MEKVLIVDDDEGLVHFLRRFLSREGYTVESCTRGEQALEVAGRESFDLILLDYKMSGMNGLDTLRELRRLQVKTPVIIMTAYGTTDTAIEAMKRGAYDYLPKPFEREELKRLVADALTVNHLMKEVVSYPDAGLKPAEQGRGAARIIGSHKRMQAVYKLIGQVAGKDVIVLITGESGTGKELVARAIYHHSHRKDKPFLAVNCAAIPETLFESELFGHERGAFTGAERVHLGKFERCDGGTLFFDEIGDMPLGTQAKVLRVLQYGEFERLGGTETLKANVRIIAATNKNLEREVEEGRFREDLYWRLKIISIELPPLRERQEDIPALVRHFIARFSEEYDAPIRYIDETVLERLQAYPWPGNVRELENCIRRAVLLSQGDMILPEHIQLARDSTAASPGEERGSAFERIERKMDELFPDLLRAVEETGSGDMLEILERGCIIRVLGHCGQNQVKAARMLGISRNTLRLRMKKFGITGSPSD
ncbi:Acetoacetate metabolism regulatory protein AtoC [uncultured Desulfatiglans sp.]|uniref:DNA-binding transcriptional regulator NtrC n=1 Tax=Uncultured Desulfatiglans sp. TaxID=1748965 RepID=A0A653A850_UNCDX|nr:Acetoacetate metabolism regulatory protein AtoC [uncultured Desulfatiglans sp.]